MIASQITSLTIVYLTVYSGADQRKHESSTPLAFVRGIHRGPVNSPHKWSVTRKMFPLDGVIMTFGSTQTQWIVGSRNQWECPQFFRGNWQSPCITLTCKEAETALRSLLWMFENDLVAMLTLLAICAGNSPVTGDFPAQRPVTRSFGVFFDLRLIERLSKQSWGWWFETPSCPF